MEALTQEKNPGCSDRERRRVCCKQAAGGLHPEPVGGCGWVGVASFCPSRPLVREACANHSPGHTAEFLLTLMKGYIQHVNHDLAGLDAEAVRLDLLA